MMKILVIFSLSLISVPDGCAMTGYAGGSIVVIWDQTWNVKYSRYICKKEGTLCKDIIHAHFSEKSVEVERFRIYEAGGLFLLFIRMLKPKDAGTYRMGVGSLKAIEINLNVVNDSCYAEPKIVSAFPGQNINIISKYPEKYEKYQKFFLKLDNNSLNVVSHTFTQSQISRFFVYEDKIARVVSVNISNVIKEDDGVYFCGVSDKFPSLVFFLFFSEIQLHVKGSSISIIIIISVCICALLIGGFALLIYKLTQRRRQSLRLSSQNNEQSELPNVPPYENLNARMTSIYQNLDSSRNQSDAVYQTLNPETKSLNSVYHNLQS